jgi:spermidine/putrescine transport system substrate-binding protein
VNYVTPVTGTQPLVEKIDPKLAKSELIFPTEASRAKLHPQVDLTASEQRQMNDAMQKVVGA